MSEPNGARADVAAVRRGTRSRVVEAGLDRPRLPASRIAAILLFLVFVAFHYDRETGFTRFIHFGDRFTATRLPSVASTHPFVDAGSMGYDGQFYAQIAVTPLLTDPALRAALDSPVYRSRRIGVPWLAWLAGAGHAAWVLQAYALINVFAWLALVLLLQRWIPPLNATSLLAWLGCAFGAGVMMSVERALTDLPSTLCIAVAILLAERARRWGAGAAFALGVLARDTSVLAGALLLPGKGGDRSDWQRAVVLGLAALLPLALWSLYVRTRFPGIQSVDGSNFAWPLSAMLGAVRDAWPGSSGVGLTAFVVRVLCVVGLSVQCLFLACSAPRFWRMSWWRAGAAFALLFTVLGPAVWQDYPAAARAVIPMTLAFNILLPRDRWWSFPLCALGNLTMLRGLHDLLAPIWIHLV